MWRCKAICSAQSRNRYNSRIVLRKVGILTLLRKVGILTLRKTILELLLRKVGIGTKWEYIMLSKVGIGTKLEYRILQFISSRCFLVYFRVTLFNSLDLIVCVLFPFCVWAGCGIRLYPVPEHCLFIFLF